MERELSEERASMELKRNPKTQFIALGLGSKAQLRKRTSGRCKLRSRSSEE